MPGFFQAFWNPFGLQMLWGLQTLQRFSLQISSWLVVSWGKERSVNSVINNRLGSTYTVAFCRHHGVEQSLLPIKSSGAVKMDAPFSSSPVFYFFYPSLQFLAAVLPNFRACVACCGIRNYSRLRPLAQFLAVLGQQVTPDIIEIFLVELE